MAQFDLRHASSEGGMKQILTAIVDVFLGQVEMERVSSVGKVVNGDSLKGICYDRSWEKG